MAAKTKSPSSTQPTIPTQEPNRVARAKPLVFVSHDTRDGDLAEAFANLLSDVSGGTLKSFRSSDKKGTSGIEFGAEWYQAIMSKLADATDVVALLTEHSVNRPWILYEAGVATGKLETKVMGLALGVPLERVSAGPFGQFQNCGDEEDQITKLVLQLISRNPEASPREEAVRLQVRVFRESIAKLLKARAKDGTKQARQEPPETAIARLFEEVKVMVGQIPEQVDDRVRQSTRRGGLRRLRRFHPGMLDEICFHPALRDSPDGPATAWFMILSLIRDEMPWIYESGLDVYHALKAHDENLLSRAMNDFERTVEVVTHSHFMFELLGPEDEESFHMARQLPMALQEILHRWTSTARIERHARVHAPNRTKKQ